VGANLGLTQFQQRLDSYFKKSLKNKNNENNYFVFLRNKLPVKT